MQCTVYTRTKQSAYLCVGGGKLYTFPFRMDLNAHTHGEINAHSSNVINHFLLFPPTENWKFLGVASMKELIHLLFSMNTPS